MTYAATTAYHYHNDNAYAAGTHQGYPYHGVSLLQRRSTTMRMQRHPSTTLVGVPLVGTHIAIPNVSPATTLMGTHIAIPNVSPMTTSMGLHRNPQW